MEQFYYSHFSLRKFVVNQDEDALYLALGHSKVVKHMATNDISKVDCAEIIKGSLEHWKEHAIGSWAVEQNNNIVGWAGFKLWKKDEFEILIVLNHKSWGLGKHIYKELVSLARNQFQLDSIIALLPDTRKSYDYIVRRAGFSHVGKDVFNGEPFQKFIFRLVD